MTRKNIVAGVFWALVVVGALWLLTKPVTNGYLKCDHCGAVYKSIGGLPGMRRGGLCRGCRKGHIDWISESESGWDEERYQRNGNEIS